MTIGGLRRSVVTHSSLWAYGIGSVFISIWTLLRFFNQRTVFDLVSQQVIVSQWLHGSITAAHMGQSAYVPKMLLLYIPFAVLPGSPRLKLIILTILLNVLTFVLLGLVLKRLLGEFKIRANGFFYGALIWLAAIAGSVFWIEFANSRNVEVVGGVFLVYLGLRLLRYPNWQRGAGVALFTSVLFFSDMLQLYMSALPLLVYAVVLVVAKKQRIKPVLFLSLALIAGYLGAKTLFAASNHFLHMSFTGTGNATLPAFSFSWVAHSLKGLAKSLVTLFSGANDAGRIRELANILFLVVGVAGLVSASVRKEMPKRLMLLIGCILVVNAAVYVASGQAAQEDTSRYLIMVVPAVILAFGAIRWQRWQRPYILSMVAAVLLLNFIALSWSLGHNWNASFPKDAHLASVDRFMSANSGTNVYASDDTALPVLYLYNLPAEHVLPVGCLNGSLVQTYYSMGPAFARDESQSKQTAAIVLDGDVMRNTPNTCTVASISQQFGQPLRTEKTDDGSVVLLYKQTSLQLPN